MKHPCKLCIVRACCTAACSPYKAYAKDAATLMTVLTVVFGGALLGSLLIYINHMMQAGSDGARMFLVIFWIVCIIVNTIVDESLAVDAGIFWKWLMAPLLTLLYTLLFLSSKYFQRA